MIEQEDWKYQARKKLIDPIMNEIYQKKNSPERYLHVYYALAKLGLHMKAEKLGLLEQEAWQKNKKIEQLIESIETFLWKEIK